MLNLAGPLDNFTLVRVRKIDDVQDALAEVYVKPRLQLSRFEDDGLRAFGKRPSDMLRVGTRPAPH